MPVSRDNLLQRLFYTPQKDQSFVFYLQHLNELADLCQIDTKPLLKNDVLRIALIANMEDKSFASKILSEELDLASIISYGISHYEIANLTTNDVINHSENHKVNKEQTYDLPKIRYR